MCPWGTRCLTDADGSRPQCISCERPCPVFDLNSGPVCGTNNVTYSNWCTMRQASCQIGIVINTKHYGQCTGKKVALSCTHEEALTAKATVLVLVHFDLKLKNICTSLNHKKKIFVKLTQKVESSSLLPETMTHKNENQLCKDFIENSEINHETIFSPVKTNSSLETFWVLQTADAGFPYCDRNGAFEIVR